MKIIHENNLDYKTLYHNMVQGLADYAIENKLNAFILGISGGLDSTIVASIAQDAAKIVGIPLIGLSLPCNTNKQEENDSANLAGKMCSVYKIINIQTLYEETFLIYIIAGPSLAGQRALPSRWHLLQSDS
jgi:NH3-dependent NAD+ synthetase